MPAREARRTDACGDVRAWDNPLPERPLAAPHREVPSPLPGALRRLRIAISGSCVAITSALPAPDGL